MAGTFSVKGWTTFQHYKDRNPPWIRFYNTTLDNYEIGLLPDATKAHLFAIWLLASRYDNRIPHDPAWVASKINATENVDLNLLEKHGLIELNQDCTRMLADCEQVGTQSRVESESEKTPPIVPLTGESAPSKKRRSQIPTTWKPTEKDIAHATNRGLGQGDIATAAERFRDYHTAKATLSADWGASWRTWVANQIKFDARDRGKSAPNGRGIGSIVNAVARLRADPGMGEPVYGMGVRTGGGGLQNPDLHAAATRDGLGSGQDGHAADVPSGVRGPVGGTEIIDHAAE